MEKKLNGFSWSLSWRGRSRFPPACPAASLLACSVLPAPEARAPGFTGSGALGRPGVWAGSWEEHAVRPGPGLLIRCSLIACSGQPTFEMQLCTQLGEAGSRGDSAGRRSLPPPFFGLTPCAPGKHVGFHGESPLRETREDGCHFPTRNLSPPWALSRVRERGALFNESTIYISNNSDRPNAASG